MRRSFAADKRNAGDEKNPTPCPMISTRLAVSLDVRRKSLLFVSIKNILWLKRMPLPILRSTASTKATGPVVAEVAVEADAIGGSTEEEEEEANTLIISSFPECGVSCG